MLIDHRMYSSCLCWLTGQEDLLQEDVKVILKVDECLNGGIINGELL